MSFSVTYTQATNIQPRRNATSSGELQTCHILWLEAREIEVTGTFGDLT